MIEVPEHTFSHLAQSMSAQRLGAYLRHADECENQALNLYHWNLKVSAEMIIPLSVTEVVIRNAIVEAIEAKYGSKWFKSKGIIRSLKFSFDKDSISKINNSGQIITKQYFSFWNNMLISNRNKKLWSLHFRSSFPNAPTDQSIDELCEHLYNNLNELRDIRNRVAHHEPIFMRRLEDDITRIDWIIRWRCSVTADWLSNINRVPDLISQRPGKPRQ